MTKFHINDEGEPGACVAKPGNCHFKRSETEHYNTKEAARTAYETNNKNLLFPSTTKNSKKGQAVNHALHTNLNYDGEVPDWMSGLNDSARNLGFASPEIVDVIESPVGPLAVVWSKNSTEEDDKFPQSKGFLVSELSFRKFKNGEIVGKLNVDRVNDESAVRAFGNDKWSSMQYAEKAIGVSFGLKERVPDESTGRTKEVLTFDIAQTDDEILQTHKRIWAMSHRGLPLYPNSITRRIKELRKDPQGTDTEELRSLSRLELYNLTANEAPDTIQEIDKDLKQIRKKTDKLYKDFKKDHSAAVISWVTISKDLRGSGFGSALYMYAGRMMGREGKTLSSSGLQSDSAIRTWERFSANSDIPTVKIASSSTSNDSNLCLDFRSES